MHWFLAQLPETRDGWGLAFAILTAISSAIGVAFKFWADRRVQDETAEANREKDRAKQLSDTQLRLIEAAERREKEANERAERQAETSNIRMEAALTGMAQLTGIVTELTNAMKLMQTETTGTIRGLQDEVRRANANIEALLRERR